MIDIVKGFAKYPNRIELKRDYKEGVTLGNMIGYIRGVKMVESPSIELKWLDNKSKVSCIPEGTYKCVPSLWHSHHDKKVIEITAVENRSRILIHPANYASGKHVQLMGCIAPVSGYADLDKDGIIDGISSQNAFNKIMKYFGNVDFTLIIYS